MQTTAVRMEHAPTQMVVTRVHVTQATLEMAFYALVCTCISHMKRVNVHKAMFFSSSDQILMNVLLVLHHAILMPAVTTLLVHTHVVAMKAMLEMD